MKCTRILIGGLSGGVLATLAMLLIQTSGDDWLWWLDPYSILLALGCYFVPGFVAGAIGAAILTNVKLFGLKKPADDVNDAPDEPRASPGMPGIGKSVLGGLIGILILAAILFGFFLIVSIFATGI